MVMDEEMEYGICEDRIYDIRRLKDSIENDMPEDVVDENKTSALGAVWDMLEKAEFLLMGRLNELNEDYCVKYERTYSLSSLYKDETEMAKKAGINFVALWELVPGVLRKEEAIRYIVGNGLASLNYAKTCEAIKAFYENGRKNTDWR